MPEVLKVDLLVENDDLKEFAELTQSLDCPHADPKVGIPNLRITSNFLLLAEFLIVLRRHDVTLFFRHAMIIEKVPDDPLESNNYNRPVLHMYPPFVHVPKSRLVCDRSNGLQLLLIMLFHDSDWGRQSSRVIF